VVGLHVASAGTQTPGTRERRWTGICRQLVIRAYFICGRVRGNILVSSLASLNHKAKLTLFSVGEQRSIGQQDPRI
jgi:hypothetical protein